MTDGVIFLCQLLQCLLHVLYRVFEQVLQLSHYFALLRQVAVLRVSGARISLVASLEEFVASIEEVLPEQFTLFARHNAHGLPFFLQCDNLVARLLPVCAISKFLCLLDEFLLLFQIAGILRFQFLEERSLLAEEHVIDGAETLKDLHVHLLRSKTDFTPFLLHSDYLLGSRFPLGSSLDGIQVDRLQLFAERSLLFEVLLLLSADFLKVLLVLLVDHGACRLETAPDLLAQFLGNRTDFAVLLVQVLQLVEGRDDIRLLVELFSSFAECGLSLEVFLEVIFTCLAVEFQKVVELLHVELVVAPQLISLVGRHGLDILPFLLQGLEVII